MSTSLIPVFRKGKWIPYTIPEPRDPLWSFRHVLRAASFYATACEQGYKATEAATLAEMFVNKEVYEGLVYDAIYERKLKQIMDHVGTA